MNTSDGEDDKLERIEEEDSEEIIPDGIYLLILNME